jgi:signal transduction histidine kinase
MKTTLQPDNGLDTLIRHLRHELRTPVAAALMHLAILERTVGELEGGARLMGNVDQARRALSSLDRLVDRTLDSYRRGAILLRREQVDLDRLIVEVLDRIGASNPAATRQISCKSPSGMVAYLDPTAVEEILANLLTNAIKFGEGKPVQLIVERPPDGVRLKVRDLGRGIQLRPGDPAVLAHARESSHRAVPGMGLGLWIVGRMVEAHAGHITVDTPPDGGTLFDVFLPG